MKSWVVALFIAILATFGCSQSTYAQLPDPNDIVETVEAEVDDVTDIVTGGDSEPKPNPRPNPKPRPDNGDSNDSNPSGSDTRSNGGNNDSDESSGTASGRGDSNSGTDDVKPDNKPRKPKPDKTPKPSKSPKPADVVIYRNITLRDLILMAVFGLTGVTVGFILIKRRV